MKKGSQIWISPSSGLIWLLAKLVTSRTWVPMTTASINLGKTWVPSYPPKSRGRFLKVSCWSWISSLSGRFPCSKIKIPCRKKMRTIKLKAKLTPQMKHKHPIKLKTLHPKKRMLILLFHRLAGQVPRQWLRAGVPSRRRIIHKISLSWPTKR
jgi:hypothetical protein